MYLELSFIQTFCSRDFDILLCFLAQKSPATEKMRLRNASDTGTLHKSKSNAEITGNADLLSHKRF